MLRISVGANSQTASVVTGGLLIAFSFFFIGSFWQIITLAAGIVLTVSGISRLLCVPWDLVEMYGIQDSVQMLSEAVRQVEEADRMIDALKGCQDGDVTSIIFRDWEKFTESEKARMSYLRDGFNDRRDWQRLYEGKRREATKQAVLAMSEIAAFYRYTRRILGVAYTEPRKATGVADATPDTSAALPQKRRPRRNTAKRTQDAIAAVAASYGQELIPDGMPEQGPSVTRYPFRIPQGVKLSKITALSDDLALSLGVSPVRIAPIPGIPSVIGVEVPNEKRKAVKFGDLTRSDAFRAANVPLPVPVGLDITGKPVIADLAAFPHALIAGTTGSGKSVFMNVIICGLLEKFSPEKVGFIMIDPKRVELVPYNDIPHLMEPVITDAERAAEALQWATEEMDRRYKKFTELRIRDITQCADMPYLVIIIDEMADLMMSAGKAAEESIVRIAQLGRAAGIHLIIATQRPTKDIVTGLIKANVPARFAFAVSSSLESRIILDDNGAEKLLGQGDMIYAPQSGAAVRVQGAYISGEPDNDEIGRVIRKWRKWKSGAKTAGG